MIESVRSLQISSAAGATKGESFLASRIVIVAQIILWLMLVVLSVAATHLLTREERAAYAFEYLNPAEGLNIATELDPTVADYAKNRGDFWLKTSIPPRLDLAADEYRRALELDPYEAFHWKDWAVVSWRLGRAEEAERSFRTAENLDSNNYVIQRDFGNFLLSQGRIDAAMAHHARAIQLSADLARSIYQVYTNLGRSPLSVAEQLLGDRSDLLRQFFFDCLVWANPEEAGQLWEGFKLRDGVLDASCYRAFFDYFITNKVYSGAKYLWHQIAEQFYRAQWDAENVILWNGSFEQPLLFDGGLEWRIAKQLPTGVRVVVSTAKGSEQSRCLWIHFDGKENVAFSHVRHLFFVEPGKDYRLGYRVNALDVTTDNGPYVRVVLHADPPLQRTGQIVTGSGTWEREEKFTVPAACHLAEIIICRDYSAKLNNRIKGDVWYDDFVAELDAKPSSGTLSK